jgi:hypothetical protein
MYTHVIPRDLFNESDLLKCYGRLYTLLEMGAHTAELSNDDQDNNEPFNIIQDELDGSISISNVKLTISGKVWRLYRPLNSRDPWPLYCLSVNGDVCERVFTDDGMLSFEFLNIITHKK